MTGGLAVLVTIIVPRLFLHSGFKMHPGLRLTWHLKTHIASHTQEMCIFSQVTLLWEDPQCD